MQDGVEEGPDRKDKPIKEQVFNKVVFHKRSKERSKNMEGA